ncbi:low temperature requirement protein A [Shimazuella kribbensis]|uniref:low temperature requirement protein A n=1 Tax=Shimazuella kribbensis TaxID=139808 RepID=UPI0003F96FCC|nr:low temperature requirement protein A [Shimazuella kribbensis]
MRLYHHIWWKKPQLQTNEQETERKASWLELFFDLIFVALIAGISHRFLDNLTWIGFRDFAFSFSAVWLVWENSTFYNERFEVFDIRHRIFTFLKMIPLAILAYSIHDPFGIQFKPFVLSFLAVRFILLYLWWSAGKANPVLKRYTAYILFIHSISISLCIFSIFVPAGYHIVLIGIAMIIDFLMSFGILRFQETLPRISRSHLPERFGLFNLLVIAEIIIGVIKGASSYHHLTWEIATLSALGLLLSFAIWWAYFDLVIFVSFRKKFLSIIIWTRLHLPLSLSVAALGIGLQKLIKEPKFISDAVHWIMCGSISVILFALFLLILVSDHSEEANEMNLEFKHVRIFLANSNLVASVLAILIGFFGKGTPAIVLLSLLVSLVIIQCILALYVWVKAQLNN